MSRISGVFHGSTAYVSEGFGSHASRSTVMGGSAIVLAAAAFKDRAARGGGTAARLRAGCGRARRRQSARMTAPRSISPNSPGCSAEAAFVNDKRTYAYGTHAAHVAVDPRTGAVELVDYVAVEDVGRIINPRRCTAR